VSRTNQEFANAPFNVTDTLLALAFFKLSSVNVCERKDGFWVLFPIGLSTVVLRDPHANVGGLIQKMIRLKSLVAAQHPELSENLLHKELCKVDPEGSVFPSVIAPWLTGLKFNRQDKAGVVVGVEPRFVLFSTVSFIAVLVEDAIHIPLNRVDVRMINHVLDQRNADRKTLTLLTMPRFRYLSARCSSRAGS